MVGFFEHTSSHILAQNTFNMVITTYMVNKIRESQNNSESEFEKLEERNLENSQEKLTVKKEIQ